MSTNTADTPLPSLTEVHRSVDVPASRGFWRKVLAYAGPGYLVAVGYMDPGNWATDLAGGSAYGYKLLSVVLLSSLMAMLLLTLVRTEMIVRWQESLPPDAPNRFAIRADQRGRPPRYCHRCSALIRPKGMRHTLPAESG